MAQRLRSTSVEPEFNSQASHYNSQTPVPLAPGQYISLSLQAPVLICIYPHIVKDGETDTKHRYRYRYRHTDKHTETDILRHIDTDTYTYRHRHRYTHSQIHTHAQK